MHGTVRLPETRARTTLGGWAVALLCLAVALALAVPAFRSGLFDAMATDDAMRLVEVRDLLAGQSWFDLTQHRLDPPQGFAAQTATASILWATAHFGFPVSTTHTVSGSVLGAGAVRGFSAVRWGVAGNILVAWILTLPAAALVGAFMEIITRLPGGHVIVFVLAIVIAASAFLARRIDRRRLAVPPERLATPTPA
jgi:hypothetical protein